jgi:hypothetical protein
LCADLLSKGAGWYEAIVFLDRIYRMYRMGTWGWFLGIGWAEKNPVDPV